MNRVRLSVLLWLVLSGLPLGLQAAEDMTNQDIVDLVKSGLSETVIVAAVKGSSSTFDTSATAIIGLSKAGVPDSVIQAMLDKDSGIEPVNSNQNDSDSISPETVTIVDGGKKAEMKYLTPQIRTAARALGWGGVAQYATLRGTKATLRTSSTPSFIIAVPNNAQPENYYTIAHFAVRKNGTREVIIGGGYMSYSTGIHRDRVMAASSELLEDQSQAPAEHSLYKVTPDKPLAAGEYGLVLYSSVIRTAGFFASGLDSYFDFGVD